MGELLQLVLSSIEYLWPFVIVHEWEQGSYYIFGKYWKTFGPGVYFRVPFFTRMIEISVAPHILKTPRMDLTLADGTGVSLSVSAWMRVTDVAKATNTVNDWEHTTHDLMQTVVADKIAEIGADRLASNKRRALLNILTGLVQAEASEYGVDVMHVRFTSMVLKVRTLRLLNDNQGFL